MHGLQFVHALRIQCFSACPKVPRQAEPAKWGKRNVLGSKVKPIGFELLPDKFTLVQLQDLYEAIYQRSIDKRNFRKKILSMDLLQKFDEKEKNTSKKGAYYYKFIAEKYQNFRQNGFYFNLDVY